MPSFGEEQFLCFRISKPCCTMEQHRSVILNVTLCLLAGCLSHCLARWTWHSSPWTHRGVRCNWRAVSVTSITCVFGLLPLNQMANLFAICNIYLKMKSNTFSQGAARVINWSVFFPYLPVFIFIYLIVVHCGKRQPTPITNSRKINMRVYSDYQEQLSSNCSLSLLLDFSYCKLSTAQQTKSNMICFYICLPASALIELFAHILKFRELGSMESTLISYG